MRHTILIITFLLVAGLAVGCTPKDGKSAAGPKHRETAAAQREAETKTKEADQAGRDYAHAQKEAVEARQDYAYAQKAEFVDKMKKELVGIQEELDRLSAKVDRSRGAAKAEAKTQLEAVRAKWAQAKKQLDRAESATESTWDDVKGGFKKSYGELKDSFEKTRQWLSEKIEP